jgi:hypothetical protein
VKAFTPALWRAARSVKAAGTYAAALKGLSTWINRTVSNGTVVFERSVGPGNYHVSTLYSFGAAGWGLLEAENDCGQVFFSLAIDSQSRYRRMILRVTAAGRIRLRFRHLGGADSLLIYAVGLKEIAAVPDVFSGLKIGPDSVCAALATYPQRRRLLRATVRSLVDQVDHLFIYLNNYRYVPDFLTKEGYRDKVHFIVDSSSSYRAAAKFWWLSRYRCYWLVCDDDIIYPDDYAATMIAKLRSHDRRAVVGVHGTIFRTALDGMPSSARETYSMQQDLAGDRRVNMLGTGTVALHSSVLSASAMEELLNYPIENDEILAVLCRNAAIPQYAVQRRPFWLQSNPRMQYGIFEETQLDPQQLRRVEAVLSRGEPWPDVEFDVPLAPDVTSDDEYLAQERRHRISNL